MKALTVLYDEHCPLCIRSARWLQSQEAFLPLECLAAGSAEVLRRYGEVFRAEKKELTVIDDRGGVYRGTDAWLMCLFALVDYREWSTRLATPSLKPLARTAFEALSTHRQGLSRLLWAREAELREGLRAARPDPGCAEDACEREPILQATPVQSAG